MTKKNLFPCFQQILLLTNKIILLHLFYRKIIFFFLLKCFSDLYVGARTIIIAPHQTSFFQCA